MKCARNALFNPKLKQKDFKLLKYPIYIYGILFFFFFFFFVVLFCFYIFQKQHIIFP